MRFVLALQQAQQAFYEVLTRQANVLVNAAQLAIGTPAYDPAWYALTDIYWDPAGTVGGSDSNTGQLGSPVLTFAEIVHRYGTDSPIFNYGQSVTVHQLTAQPPGQDPVCFYPRLSGGGQAVLLCSLIIKSAQFVGGAVTARVQATGTLLAVAGFPAGTAVGDYVFNVTRNSYAVAVTGGVTPTFTTPVPASVVTTPGIPTLAEDNTWTTGDSFVVYTRPNCNLKVWQPKAGDVGTGGANNQASCGWVQWASIPDTSTTGASVYLHHNESCTNVLSGCQILSRCHLGSIGGRGFSTYLVNCDCAQAVLAFGSNLGMWGVLCRSTFTATGGEVTFDGGSVLLGAAQVTGCVLFWGDGFSSGAMTVCLQGVLQVGVAQGGATAAYWGTGGINVQADSSVQVSGTTFAATLLTSGALQLGGNANGSKYAAGVWTDGQAITAAALDTNSGLQSPRSGARFAIRNS